MKRFVLLSIFLSACIITNAQELNKVLRPATDEEAINLITVHINLLRSAIQNIAHHTPGYDRERPIELFIDKNAPVEVSTVPLDTTLEITTKTSAAEVYFKDLYNLVPNKYDKVVIDFLPSKMNIKLTEENGKFYASPEIAQGFRAYKNGEEVYHDITIKRIGVVFGQRKNGFFFVKIVSIEVVNKKRK